MRKTIAEKILSSHAKKDLKASDIAICEVDFCYSQDGTSALVIDSFKALYDKEKLPFSNYHMVIDHSAPSPNQGVSEVHKKMRKFCDAYGVVCHDVGEGVCHEVLASEDIVLPGQLICGADSHTCTLGAVGAFATGMGSTDISLILANGQNWFKVPETIRFELNGNLSPGVFAKDLILQIIGRLKADGATYKALEYHGEGKKNLDMDARFTIANMSVEMGAKTGIFPPDEVTLQWLKKRKSSRDFYSDLCHPDEDASYSEVKEINLNKVTPKIAKPHRVDNVCSIGEIEGLSISQVYIGTCTNGRFSDLKVASDILKGNKVHSDTQLIVAPASKEIYLKTIRSGIIENLVQAGACIVVPGCGPCVGTHNGIPSDGENVLSTANRNFKGRMGNPNSFIYLASPATAAYSSIKGEISDPRKILN